MGRTRHFKELFVWQRSMRLARRIYEVTSRFPADELYGLRSQLRRAVVSVPSNIAEGHGRLSDQLFRTFLAQARGSLYEVQTQLILAGDLEYIAPVDGEELLLECDEIARMLNGLIGSLKAKTDRASRSAAVGGSAIQPIQALDTEL